MEKMETMPDKIELENWMTNLPYYLRKLPLIYLAIPGSHDSMTFAITHDSKIAPDAEPLLQRLSFLGPIPRYIMSKWSKTQGFNVVAQLKTGVRYFDLRLATRKGTDKIYFVHGLYSCEVDQVLHELKDFLVTHPLEVVILDCQHFYAFGPSDHERLMRLLISVFEKSLVPYSVDMNRISLHAAANSGHQVLIVYRSDAARFGQPLLWPSFCFPSPWPNTTSMEKLFEKLNQFITNRPTQTGFITQCVLTPSAWFVCRYLFSSLKKKCVVPLQQLKYQWIREQHIGPSGVNIIIADYVDLLDSQFSKEVVSLNYNNTMIVEK